MTFRAGDATRGNPDSPRKQTLRSTSTGQPLKVLVSDHEFQKPGFYLPRTHHLIITTTGGVFTWDHEGIFQIFKSGSEGIVAAKTTNGRILAVADSQLVFLHDVSEGMQQSYRLKSKQGRVHMLHFDPNSERLYFTTTLQNAVQSFSLKQGELLDPTPAHASPVSVFALSPGFDILLSASNEPPTVLVTHLGVNRLPTLVQPECSATPVVATAFHPERGNVFALAFADGTVAVYNVLKLLSNGTLNGSGRSYGGIRGELGHIRNLHISTTDISLRMAADPLYGIIDHTTGASTIGDLKSGINAITFIPGRRCTTVSVASDGRCCIVNFEKRDARRGVAEIINHWQTDGPAISLCVMRVAPNVDAFSNTHSASAPWAEDGCNPDDHCIAIGRADGTVLLYDFGGDILARRRIGPGGHILGIEWIQRRPLYPTASSSNRALRRASVRFDEIPHPRDNETDTQPWGLHGSSNTKQVVQTTDGNVSSIFMKPQPSSHKSGDASQPSQPEMRSYPQFTKFGSGNAYFPKTYLQENRANQSRLDSSTSSRSRSTGELRDIGTIVRRKRQKPSSGSSATSANSAFHVRYKRKVSGKSTRARKAPIVPPRPVPKVGGKWAKRRAETAEVHKVDPDDVRVINVRGKTKTWDSRGRPIELSEDDPFAGPSKSNRASRSQRRVSTLRVSPTDNQKSYHFEEYPPDDIPARKESLYQTSPTSTDDYDIEWSANNTANAAQPETEPSIMTRPSMRLQPNLGSSFQNTNSSYATAPDRKSSKVLSFPSSSNDVAVEWPLQSRSPTKPDPIEAPKPPVLLRSPEKKSLFPTKRSSSALSPKKNTPYAPPRAAHMVDASGSPQGWDFAFDTLHDEPNSRDWELRPPTRGKDGKGRASFSGKADFATKDSGFEETSAKQRDRKTTLYQTIPRYSETDDRKFNNLEDVKRELVELRATLRHDLAVFKEEVVLELQEHRRWMKSLSRD